MTRSNRWLTWANGITGIRLLLAPLLAWAVVRHWTGWALLIFGLAVLTDWADGRIARRRGETSSLGGVLDHATDAVFVSVGLAAYAALGAVPMLLPGVIVVAFVQYALDSQALLGRPLRTSRIGRSNGLAYFCLLGLLVLREAARPGSPPSSFIYGLGWLLVLTSAVSIVDRAVAWWSMRKARDSPDAGTEAQLPR